MFTPRAFAETDLQWLDALFARDAFITLLTTGDDGLPELTRLPVLYRRQGQAIELRGHWARANPQSRRDGLAKVLVDGPHGYVSASWYPDKEAIRLPLRGGHRAAEDEAQPEPPGGQPAGGDRRTGTAALACITRAGALDAPLPGRARYGARLPPLPSRDDAARRRALPPHTVRDLA
ncbi:hypothetical protein QE373_001501 [Stenotrophomonas sp. SORGH_AS321]|nr:hypothetical protein [Stenotrophomonas sp. SORGH_AS_0321]